MSNLDVFDLFNRDYSREQLETMSLRDWLLAARDDKMLYASPAERMISAIGEQELIDTAQDPRLGRLFFNRTIKRYKAFEGFYGIERHRLTGVMSPWAVKRLDEFGGDISKFEVARLYPSKLRQIAVAKTEPGDDNNQDISALVGKVDIRKLEHFSQNDPDAYSFSGGLCRANQGLLEFVEMFKAPIKVLHPLLTATQEGNYKGTEGFGAIPYDGIVLAHSNESEWKTFRNNKNNEAFLDRIYIVKVPYCLRVSDETQIYRKLILQSELTGTPCAPETLEILA